MSSSEDDHNPSEEEEESEDEVRANYGAEEEDSENEAPPPKRKQNAAADNEPKKRRKRMNKFIEDEADVDEDDEEEEDEEDGFYPSESAMAEEAERAYSQQYKPQDRSNFDDEFDAEDIVNNIKKRHQQSRRHYGEDDEGGDMVQSDVAQQSLLPSIQDPRLWVFKCKPGREQHLVLALMNKYLEMARQGDPLQIKSVVASNSKGFIYVEADREPHVKDAVNGLRDIQQYSMKLVPVHEMTSVLTIQSKRKPLKPGQWARMKRAGLYKGDLCKVVEILDNGTRAVVRLIPRLDPTAIGGEQPKHRKGQRPPQKFFGEHMAPPGEVTRRRHPATNEQMEFFDGEYYLDGFLMKDVSILTMLTTEDVNPTLDEINKFASGGDDDKQEGENEQLMAAAEASDWKNKVELTKGDTVRVVEGDLVNLMGVVLSTNSTNDTVRVMPLHEEIKDTILDFQLNQLMKFVKVGDHIKVVSGRYSGETGTVVAVDESGSSPVAIVLVDSMAKEIQVRVQDLQESAEVSHGLDSFKGKELYDLVALAHGEVGVITHVGRDGFTVVTQNAQARNISDQEIQRKMVSSRAPAALDSKHNHVSVGEMVNVIDGPFVGHSGTIKHMYRTYLWLHNNRMTSNAGIFVVRARQVVLAGSKARSNLIQNSTVPRNDMQRGPASRGPNNRESELVGKTVKIKKGRWKGYIGIVVDESEQKVKVEVHSQAKVVDVDRLNVTVAGTRQGMLEDRPKYSATPMSGQTPMPGQTPLHGSAMTPMATPMHPGMSTPQSRSSEAWNVANDDALLETQLNQEKDVAHANSFGTPLDPATPGGDMNKRSFATQSGMGAPETPGMSASTPSAGTNPVTPGMNPTTPGLQPRTPGGYGLGQNPTTPGANLSASTPGMPDHGGSHMEPMTPGFNPTTPGMPATTPGMHPVTPGVNTPGYQNPMTPGGFGVATPATGMGRMGVQTPGVATPGAVSGPPATPAANQGGSDQEVTWWSKNVEVEVIAGEHQGNVGVISSVHGASCTLDMDGRSVNVNKSEVRPVTPVKQDTVLILEGDDAGKTGSLIGTHSADGIVKVEGNSDIKIYTMSALAKVVQ